MMRFLSAIMLCGLLSSVSADIITNGDFENDTTGWIFKTNNTGAGSFSIETPGQSDTGNCAVVSVTSASTNNYYYVQILQTPISIDPAKSYTISFWAKADAAKLMQLAFQETKTYTSSGNVYKSVSLTTEWQKFEYTNITRPESDTAIGIQLAFSVGGTTGKYYFDDVQITSTGDSVTVIDDDWYSKADERIKQYRKGDFNLTVKKNGTVVPACSVKVNMKKGEFLWGTCLTLGSSMTTDEQKYRDTATKYFNYGVFENVFKWNYMESSKGNVSYTEVNRYLAWADSVGWDLRGHTLIWGRSDGNNGMPSWTVSTTFPTDSLVKACSTRVSRDVKAFTGTIKEYDVVNEPLHQRWLDSTLGGDKSIYIKSFNWARAADSTAELFINEYNILEYTEKDSYLALIDKIIQGGAKIDGIGIQGHLTKEFTWKDIAQNLQTVADYGLPIKITENDIDMSVSQDSIAKLYATVMRVAFSHPSVTSYVFWGFWAGRHWRPNGAFFDTSWSKRIAADTVYNLIHNVWSTNLDTATNSNGIVSFNGFNGTYAIQVKDGDEWKTFDSSLSFSSKGNTNLTIDIGTGTVGTINNAQKNVKNRTVTHGVFTGKVTIFDCQGRVLAKYNEKSGVKLRVSASGASRLYGAKLSKGTYFVKVISGDSEISKKVVQID